MLRFLRAVGRLIGGIVETGQEWPKDKTFDVNGGEANLYHVRTKGGSEYDIADVRPQKGEGNWFQIFTRKRR